jgi:hypothetical protein
MIADSDGDRCGGGNMLERMSRFTTARFEGVCIEWLADPNAGSDLGENPAELVDEDEMVAEGNLAIMGRFHKMMQCHHKGV